MKIRTEPMLGGAAFSFVFLLIINVIYVFIVMSTMQQMVDAVASGLYDPTTPPPSLTSPLMSLFSCLACLSPLIAGIGAGVIYARQCAKTEPITGSLASGGAASGALGFFISGIASGILGGLMMIPLMNQLSALDPSMAGSMGSLVSAGIMGSLMVGVCSGLIYAVIGALLGMIGATVGVPKSAKAA